MSGIAFLIMALVVGRRAFVTLPNGRSMKGTITALEPKKFAMTHGKKLNRAIITYEVNGTPYTTQSPYYSANFQVGRSLALKVNPDAPEQVIVRPSFYHYFWMIAFAGVGIGLLLWELYGFLLELGVL
ncbi:MAG: hypothetical protein R3Y07_03370 [Eubacteriales bacterium]